MVAIPRAQGNMAPKALEVVAVTLPPASQRVRRDARPAAEGEKKTRYHLPTHLDSTSPVGYRTRLPLTREEAVEALRLLSLERPSAFVPGPPITDQALFEMCSLGVLTSRQSTNYRGHRQISFGPEDSGRVAELLRQLGHREAEVLDGAAATHVVLSRPYRTPFTMLLTLVGHRPLLNLLTVPIRILRKRFQHIDDIPTIGYLQQLHLGFLAEAMERAAVLASDGLRRAQVHLAPFCGGARAANRAHLKALGALCGLTRADRAKGWRVAMVVQEGHVAEADQVRLPPGLSRKLAANLLAFRSERIQPGVNAEPHAPEAYQTRQDMTVSTELQVMAGRAAYNAFAHWAGQDREQAKEILLLDRVDVLSPGGKARLRAIREEQGKITDDLVRHLPKWADWPTGRLFSRNAERGRKAFALVGQRIYISGLSRSRVQAAGLDWERGVCAVGAAAARSALYCELMGCVDLPEGCDLLAGICVMAGPVNQNDIGKQFYGYRDLLADATPEQDPTSLLVWTLKAKTVADPIGNEEQLLNAKRKGALVDLRCGPHQLVTVAGGGGLRPFRRREDAVCTERAFADQGNFVTAPDGAEIPGNRGEPWPDALRDRPVW